MVPTAVPETSADKVVVNGALPEAGVGDNDTDTVGEEDIIKVTVTVAGLFNAEGSEIVMVPVYVPTARPEILTLTAPFCELPAVTLPETGLKESHV